jgi:hypothetical protein
MPFLIFALIFYARQTFNDLPGPRWVKVALVVICLAIPGPQDEIMLILITRACRAYRQRKAGTMAVKVVTNNEQVIVGKVLI